MVYAIVKFFVRLALQLFCRSILVNNRKVLNRKGPLLLASNHPNSFLDAIVIGSLFIEPIHFLARGDVFRKPFVRKLLGLLKLVPIYRLSEGKAHLSLNDETFETCRRILLQGGIVLIFSEGICRNEWTLRTLKKGTARIAWDAWHQPALRQLFQVVPVSLTYNGFSHFGKRIVVHFGNAISNRDVNTAAPNGLFIQQLNSLLKSRLQDGLLLPDVTSATAQFIVGNLSRSAAGTNPIHQLQQWQQQVGSGHYNHLFSKLKQERLIALTQKEMVLNAIGVITLAIPAFFSWIFHAPLYLAVQKVVSFKIQGTVFYNSLLFGFLLLLYPVYWLLLNMIFLLFLPGIYLQGAILLLPVLAWVFIIWRECLQRWRNCRMLAAAERQALTNLLC